MVSAGELSCIINFMNIFKKIHFYTALLAAKTVNRGLHLMKHAGTSLPGVVALKIQKDFISFANEYCQKKIITITGTNGKTTTAGILAHILKTAQNNVLHNEKGANMLSGIASSLAVNYKPFSKFWQYMPSTVRTEPTLSPYSPVSVTCATNVLLSSS